MAESSQNKIKHKIQSLREISNISYARPVDKTEEFHSNLLQNQDALLYLLRDRKLDLKTIEHFKLGLGEKGNLAIPIYKKGKLIDYKFRTLPPKPKGFSRFQGSETWIFNEEGLKEGRKRGKILIVEGEIDAMSIWQVGITNVISLVGGAQQGGPWIRELDDIERVYICLDNDEPGQKAARNLADRLGIEKCINVKLPVKDANDFFKKYSAKEFRNVLKNSDKFPIKDVARLVDLYDSVKSNKLGTKDFNFHYPTLDLVTGGFNRANVIVVSGETAHGKSSFMFNVAINLCKHDTPILYVPLEDSPVYMARRMFNIVSGVEVSQLREEDWKDLKNKIRKLPFYFYTAQDKFDLNIFRKTIEEGKKIHNIEIFILDHLHFLSKRSNRKMSEEIGFLMRELVDIARYHNVTIFVISHIRKKQAQGGWTSMPDMNELRDSQLVKGDAHMIIMLFRAKKNDKTIIQLAVQKNREGNTTTKHLEFDFDAETGIIKEYFDQDKDYYEEKEKEDETYIPDVS